MRKSTMKKYKCLIIREDELNAIINAREQIRNNAENAEEDYAEWASKQIELINSFISKIKII